ncbi:MAG TPA: MoxR family ATPase [Rhizomicrobium sp.]|nr:MoxR family ATPase [Rhizomicrobium sp.]
MNQPMNPRETQEPLKGQAVAQAEKAAATFARVREGIGRSIFGQRAVIDQALITLLSGGHGLLVGVPGLAKTRLVEALGVVLGLDWKRIQFTPDLMPGDIIGSEVLDDANGTRAFRFIRGPVFAQLLMADEINRASPRTQSALLQAMQERHVTIAGARHDLPAPFHVIATQNPLEQEGTYPLPEAQLDRFLMQIDVGYPDEAAERQMLLATTFGDEEGLSTLCGPNDLVEAQKVVRRIPVGETVVDAILKLVRSARPGEESASDLRDYIAWGPGPRASQAFMLAVRARALLDGRLAPNVEDVIALAQPVLKHRMALNFSARAEGTTITGVIDRLCQSL